MRHFVGKYVGQQFGTYRLTRLLGRGGYAEVYLGEHIHLSTQAAVKVLQTQLTEEQAENFLNEARTVAHMQHPHIVRVLEFDIEETQEGAIPFLVMEHAPDGNLAEFRPNGLPLPWISIESYIKQVASALQYAHDNKLIHRDVKPSNMLLRNDHKEVVLTDFGIALAVQSTSDSGIQEVVGTLSYMAPEQILGKAVPASDQYALGVVMYEWLSGDVPFRGTKLEVGSQHLHASPPSLIGKVPADVEQVLLKALSKDPHSRYPGVQEFADALVSAYQQSQRSTLYNVSYQRTIAARGSVAAPQPHIFPMEPLSPVPEPPPPEKATTGHLLISQYHEVLRNYYHLVNEYERKKYEFEQRYNQEKETIGTTLKEARSRASAEASQIQNTVHSTQRAILSSRWRDIVKESLPAPSLFPEADDPVQQITFNRIQIYEESRKLRSLLNKRTVLKRFRTALKTLFTSQWSPFVIIAIIICIILIFAYWGGFGLLAVSIGIVFFFALVFAAESYMASSATGEIRNSYASLMKALALIENLYRQQDAQFERTYHHQLAENYNRYTNANNNIDQAFQVKLTELRSILRICAQEAHNLIAEWNDPIWQRWKPAENTTSVTRLGVWTVVGREALPATPAIVACPGGENVLFKAAGQAKKAALAAIQSLMLRLLVTQPPGKLRFTLIDPVGLGDSVATFMQLADDDEKLVSSRAWTEPAHIEKQLADLSEHMENVIQKYLRNQYDTIDDYNAIAGQLAEPYRILVVIGFPANFTSAALRRLMSITTNGPRCGVSTLMLIDTEQPLPRNFNLAELERHANVIAWKGQGFDWVFKYDDIRPSRLITDTPPPSGLFQQLLKSVGEKARETQKVEIPFRRMVERLMPEEDWWADSNGTNEEIYIPLGPTGATKYQYLRFGKGTAHHALIVGKTGSGKTNLLQVLIVGLCLTYSPYELELYLVDFKTVGFTAYAKYRLPHARVVAIQSEREFGLSVLRGLDEELEQRKIHFSSVGVQDIAQFRVVRPKTRMPRILLLIDEFQELFSQEDKIAKEAEALLDKLVRMGRAFGIHVMLGSQTLAGAHTLLRSTISQMAIRIALQCEEADSRLILSEDNTAARLLSRPGEAIYNAENGAVAGNNTFQCVWLPDEEIRVYLNAIQQLAQRHQYSAHWTQIIFDGSRNADVHDNQLFRRVLAASTWPEPQRTPTVWLGNPIDIKDPTSLQLLPQAGSNLLIVGQQAELALSLLVITTFCLAAQHAPGSAVFYVLDFTPADAPHLGVLEWIGERLPHTVKVVKRRGLSSAIIEIGDELDDRKEEDKEQRPFIYLFIYGLQRARDLREDTGFNEASDAASLSKRFSAILRDGPELGVHTLAWCDTFTNVSRTLERGILREFDMRIAFQMSGEDSTKFLDTSQANKLNQYRAVLYSEEKGSLEKFIPYSLPSKEWIGRAIEQIRQKK